MYRSIDGRFWTDEKVRKLDATSKYLLLYLITNPHGHVSGIYYLPRVLISHETGLSMEQLKYPIDTLSHTPSHTPSHTLSDAPSKGHQYPIDTLSKGNLVFFDVENDLVWVRNMLRFQGRGLKISRAVANHLSTLPKSPLIPRFLEYYKDRKIPYQYPIDTLSHTPSIGDPEQEQYLESKDIDVLVPSTSVHISQVPKKGGVVGGGETAPPDPPGEVSEEKPETVEGEIVEEDENPHRGPLRYENEAKEILAHLNAIGGRGFQMNERNLGIIRGRLKEGFSVAQLKAVCDEKLQDPFFVEKPHLYAPTTLFRASNCERYVQALGRQVGKREYQLARTQKMLNDWVEKGDDKS